MAVSDSALPMPAEPLRSGTEFAPLWRHLGIESCRVSQVELASMVLEGARWMTEGGEVSGSGGEHNLESTFPGAAARVAQLGAREIGEVVSHRLSPRRWVFAWRLPRGSSCLVAEVRYRDGRTTPSEFDAAVIRLICQRWFEVDSAAALLDSEIPQPGWPIIERRASQPLPRSVLGGLVLIAATVLLAAWVAVFGGGAAERHRQALQQEAGRLASLAQQTVASALGSAIAQGDYGEVQSALEMYAGLGHFTSAAVVNPRDQVVAAVAPPPELRVGVELPSALARDAQAVPLQADGTVAGRLLVLGPRGDALAANGSGLTAVRLAGAAIVPCALGAAALVLMHWRGRRRRTIG